MSHASLIVALPPGTADIAAAVEEAMAPYDENTVGEWFADGTRWDWWVIGGRFSGTKFGTDIDVITRGRLDTTALESMAEAHAREAWKYYQDGGFGSPPPDKTEDEYVARCRGSILWAYAFLKDHIWYENERMGWWGRPARTECELKALAAGDTYEGRCSHTCPKTGAKIITASESEESWQARYWRRFIRDLSDDTVLVCVDYHV